MHEQNYHRSHDWQGHSPQSATPRLDVYRTESAYRFVFELPGVGEDQVDIFYEPGAITIEGNLPDIQELGQPISVERPSGRFTRSVSIPHAVEPDQINASFDRGLLMVEVAEDRSSTRRRVRVGRRANEQTQELED